MRRVLLIADTERVQRIFSSLETREELQLRTAATLDLGDQEMSASAPEFIFVQSRISGFSGEILLRYLKKSLPKSAKVILLAGDANDAAQAKQLALPFLDLSVEDEALADGIRRVISGEAPARKKAATGKAAPAGKGRDARAKAPVLAAEPSPPGESKRGKAVAGKALAEKALAEKALAEKALAEKALAEKAPAEKAPAEKAPAEKAPAEKAPAEKAPAEKAPAEKAPAEKVAEDATAAAFPVLKGEKSRAEAGAAEAPALPEEPVETEPPVQAPGKGVESFEEIMARASAKGPSPLPAPRDVEDHVRIGQPVSGPTAAPELQESGSKEMESAEPDRPIRGVPLADAMLRAQKKKRPRWMLPLALALLLIPIIVYIVGRMSAPPESPVTQHADPLQRNGKSEGRAPEPGKPAVKAGVKMLPPIIEGLQFDPAYGKSNPGWERYVGARAQYKLFREENLYRAIQVLPLGGGALPEEIFKRVLLEFGGVESYQIKSTEKKGDYVLEHAVGNGGVALTIYRSKDDLKIKGLVVYYR